MATPKKDCGLSGDQSVLRTPRNLCFVVHTEEDCDLLTLGTMLRQALVKVLDVLNNSPESRVVGGLYSHENGTIVVIGPDLSKLR